MAKAKAKKKEPLTELLHGKCENLLPERFSGPKTIMPKLIVADPPYNYGEPYDVHDDHQPFDDYLNWTMAWLTRADAALHPHGSMFLFYPDELVSEVDFYCKRNLGLYKRAHIVWYYTFGVCNAGGKNFSRSHTHILYYVKKKTRFTFNDAAVRVPSARALVYNDKRASANGKMPDNTWMLLKKDMDKVLLPDQDTWLENRVCGTYRERKKDHPNQIPLPIMERIVLAASDPGDLVCDPFVGSGTTGVVCRRHARDFVGMDVSKNYLAGAKQRILTDA